MQSKFAGTCTACGRKFAAGTAIEWIKGAGARHATPQQCAAAQAAQPLVAQQSPLPLRTANLTKVRDFILSARDRGLKSPRLRVLAADGHTEVRLGLTRSGIAPGSVSIVVGGTYIGSVRPDGTVTSGVSDEMIKHLEDVANDPAAAAKRYAVLMGLCSFCNLPLTDEGSVEVGYGPVCAKHWGLPHTPKGSPDPQRRVV